MSEKNKGGDDRGTPKSKPAKIDKDAITGAVPKVQPPVLEDKPSPT